MIEQQEELAKYLSKRLETSGRPQVELARFVNLTPPAISNILRGTDLPSERVLLAMAAFLKLDPDTALSLYKVEKTKRQFPATFDTFLDGWARIAELVLTHLLFEDAEGDGDDQKKKVSYKKTTIDIMVTWLHTSVISKESGFAYALYAFLKEFAKTRLENRYLEIRLCTASPANLGLLGNRFVLRALEGAKGANSETSRLDRIGDQLTATLLELRENDEWIEKRCEEFSSPESGISIEHRHSFGWFGFPSVLVKGEVALCGMYPAHEGYCHVPASPAFNGSNTFNLVKQSNALVWTYALEANSTLCGGQSDLNADYRQELRDSYNGPAQFGELVSKYVTANYFEPDEFISTAHLQQTGKIRSSVPQDPVEHLV